LSQSALERLREWHADTAIVLGSGLGALVPEEASAIAYSEFPEIPPPSVPGHAGRFAFAQGIIFAQGRVHLYEGHSARVVTSIVRVLAAAGVKRLVLTNAAGSANATFMPASWMMICDQLNLTGASPLTGAPQFVDLTHIYSSGWRDEFRRAADSLGLILCEGVYAGLSGPQYETPAEVRMLRALGADAIGMSTVLEAIQARALGLQVAGFSCLTNWAAGLSAAPLSHAEVLETGARAANDFSRLLSAALTLSLP
jgi:purine-nucleoside phosphorylase